MSAAVFEAAIQGTESAVAFAAELVAFALFGVTGVTKIVRGGHGSIVP